MTAPNAPSVRDVALDAAVRRHFESLHSAGVSVPFERIGDRSRRIVREQLTGLVDAVLDAVLVDLIDDLQRARLQISGRLRICNNSDQHLPNCNCGGE